MKIVVNKKSTINIGNYSNIQPNVELSIDNVKIGDTVKVFDALSEIASCLYGLNFIDLVNEADMLGTLTSARIKELINITDKEQIIQNINMKVKELKSLGYDI